MSCRETSGNSATTSLIKFLTGAPEKLVSHEFHNLRRDAKETPLVESPDEKASAESVKHFLNGLRTLASNDARVKESRRASLLSRIDAALDDAENGRGPNQATFYAWTRLEATVDASKNNYESEDDISDMVGYTPEGVEISLGDVQAARRMAEGAQLKADSRSELSRVSDTYNQKYARKEAVEYFTQMQDKAQRLEAAFDATDVGYKLLMDDERRSESHPEHSLWSRRVARADTNRATRNAVAEAWNQASELATDEILDRRLSAWNKIRHYEGLVADGKQSSSNAAKLDNARKEAQHAQRVFLYKIGQETNVKSIARSHRMSSPSEWASLPSDPAFDRFDIWRSAELIAADVDRANIRIGRITKTEAARRELMRAESRQAILDAEGKGIIDPVNKRFAESEKQKRARLLNNGIGKIA